MKHTNLILYGKTLVLGVIIWIFSLLYYVLQQGFIGIYSANRALTFTGGILILLSFALSGLSYFWGIGKGKLGYRKELGVIGFGFIILHMLISDYLFANGLTNLRYFFSQPAKFLPSTLAVCIYIMMIAVSNFGVPAKIGAIAWRRLLRIGYAAIFLSIIHFSLISYQQWINWYNYFLPKNPPLGLFIPQLPPLSLILFILSILTLLLRLALQISLMKKAKNNAQP
jgi:DMSO/TMAO reductase YedYZ heme-binding membrane subunit